MECKPTQSPCENFQCNRWNEQTDWTTNGGVARFFDAGGREITIAIPNIKLRTLKKKLNHVFIEFHCMCLDNWNFFERKKKYFYSFIILIASHILAPLGLCCEGMWPRSLPHWLTPYQWIWNSVSRLIINVHTTITQMASTRNFQIIRKKFSEDTNCS